MRRLVSRSGSMVQGRSACDRAGASPRPPRSPNTPSPTLLRRPSSIRQRPPRRAGSTPPPAGSVANDAATDELVGQLLAQGDDNADDDLRWLYSDLEEYSPSDLVGKPIPGAGVARARGGVAPPLGSELAPVCARQLHRDRHRSGDRRRLGADSRKRRIAGAAKTSSTNRCATRSGSRTTRAASGRAT